MLWNIHAEPIDTKVDFSASGDNSLIAADSAGYNYIFNFSIVVAGATSITIKCGTREVGKWALQANGTLSISASDYLSGQPYFICRPGEAFIINNSAAVNVTGTLKYAVRTS